MEGEGYGIMGQQNRRVGWLGTRNPGSHWHFLATHPSRARVRIIPSVDGHIPAKLTDGSRAKHKDERGELSKSNLPWNQMCFEKIKAAKMGSIRIMYFIRGVGTPPRRRRSPGQPKREKLVILLLSGSCQICLRPFG